MALTQITCSYLGGNNWAWVTLIFEKNAIFSQKIGESRTKIEILTLTKETFYSEVMC
jgi:hypothetical protein